MIAEDFSILIADDNPDNLRVLEGTLKGEGYSVRVATNGEMAIMSAKTLPPDLILLDIKMPKMGGYEACQKLKEDPELKDIPVIFLSALTETFNKVRAFELGGVAYLTKPFEPAEILAYVENHLKIAQYSKELQEMNEELRRSRDGLEELVRENTKEIIEGMEKYSTLVEESNDGIVILQDGLVKFANKKMLSIAGVPEKEVLGKSLLDFVSDKDKAMVLENYKKRMAGEEAPNNYEIMITPIAGEKDLPVEINATTIPFGGRTADMAIIRDISERKKAEEEIKKLSETVKQSPMHIVITDPKGNIEYVNPAFTKCTGYTLEEVVHKNPRLIQSGQTSPEIYETLWKTILAGKTWKGELKNKRKDGSVFWERATISPSMDNHGNIEHFVAVKEDLSEMMEVKSELLTTRRHYEEFINVSKDAVTYWKLPDGVSVDLPVKQQIDMIFDSVCVDGNKAAYEVYNLSNLDELEGKKYGELVERGENIEAFELFIHHNYLLIDHEYHEKLLDGTEIYSLENWYGVVENGMLTHVWSSSKNITDMKLAEKDLWASKQKFQDMIMDLDEGFYSTTLDGKVLEHNTAFNRIAGYDEDEDLVGKPVIDFWQDPEDRDKYMEELKRRGRVSDYVVKGKKKDGDVVLGQLQAHLVKDDSGNIVRVDGTILDVTEHKRMEDSIRASLDEKNVLLKEIHHRVKNNMQIMISLLSLQSSDFKDEDSKEMFVDLQNRVRSMALVHEELYQSTSLAEIPFGEYVKKLAYNLMNTFCGRSGETKLAFDIEDVQLGLDESIPLGLLLNELITNSLKHALTCDEGGEITISAHKEGEELIIVLADNGPGMDADIDLEGSENLGMRLINMLSKQLEAKVDMNSNNGTRFTITMPLVSRYAKRL